MNDRLEKELISWHEGHFKKKGTYENHSGFYLENSSQLSIAKHFYSLAMEDMKKEILAKYQKDVNPAIVNSTDNEQTMFNVGQARGVADIIKLIKQLAENE